MAQFEGVRNGGELRDALIRASKADDDAERRRVDFAFVDARLVQSRQQLMTAIVQAIVGAMRRDPKRPGAEVGLKTPSIHSDLLWTLHSNNNIAEALRRFGVSRTTRTLILVRVAPPLDAGELVQHMTQLVDGTLQRRERIEVDVDSDPELQRRYTEQVPVTFVDGRQHDYWRVDPDRLRRALG